MDKSNNLLAKGFSIAQYHSGRYGGRKFQKYIGFPDSGGMCTVSILGDRFENKDEEQVFPVIELHFTPPKGKTVSSQICFKSPVHHPDFIALEILAGLMTDHFVHHLTSLTILPSRALNIYDWCSKVVLNRHEHPTVPIWCEYNSTFVSRSDESTKSNFPIVIELSEEYWNESPRIDYLHSLPKGFQKITREEFEGRIPTQRNVQTIRSVYFLSGEDDRYDIKRVYFSYNEDYYTGYLSTLLSVGEILSLIDSHFSNKPEITTPVLYSREWLIQTLYKGRKKEWLFFYGHSAPDGRCEGKHFLSQWWDISFEVDDIMYPTAEHWMMAQKARLFGDTKTLALILQSHRPQEAKRLGRKVSGFNPAIWDQHKFQTVIEGNYYKFSQNPLLKKYLLSTGDKVLVEASPYDKIWGIGLHDAHPDVYNPLLWKGDNLLGFALMVVRDKLRNEMQL